MLRFTALRPHAHRLVHYLKDTLSAAAGQPACARMGACRSYSISVQVRAADSLLLLKRNARQLRRQRNVKANCYISIGGDRCTGQTSSRFLGHKVARHET
jgi:hypothetical protein